MQRRKRAARARTISCDGKAGDWAGNSGKKPDREIAPVANISDSSVESPWYCRYCAGVGTYCRYLRLA